MRKKIAVWMLVGALAVGGTMPVYAADMNVSGTESSSEEVEQQVTLDGITYVYEESTDSYIVAKGPNKERVTIKTAVNRKTVSAIGENAFAGCTDLAWVTSSCKKIGSRAFAGCYNLGVFENLVVEEIAPDAFEGVECVTFLQSYNETNCSAAKDFAKAHGFNHVYQDFIEDFVVHKDVIYAYGDIIYGFRDLSGKVVISNYYPEDTISKQIYHHAFRRCSRITEVDIQEQIKSIEAYAFADCTALKKITIPASVTEISPTAFQGSPSVVIYAPEGSYAIQYAKAQKLPYKMMGTEITEKPSVSSVKVTGNSVKVTRKNGAANADYYEFAIGKKKDSASKKQYTRSPQTETGFYYLQKGTYYAFCRGVRELGGKKIYGPWSAGKAFQVKAVTPSQPKILKVQRSGSTVKVTYTKCSNATGYDLVLGKTLGKVNGESRPLNYGKLVKKVYQGSTVTATFTKVPKGTYYAGLHAYNRTSENKTKVFSPWSKAVKVRVS